MGTVGSVSLYRTIALAGVFLARTDAGTYMPCRQVAADAALLVFACRGLSERAQRIAELYQLRLEHFTCPASGAPCLAVQPLSATGDLRRLVISSADL